MLNTPLPTIRIPRLAGDVAIDGWLDEPVWRQAILIDNFARMDGSRPPTDEPVSLRLWYDDQALYLGWECIDFDIRATLLERDSRLWEEDVVEMFLTVGDLSRYFELQWSPRGVIFDAIIENKLGADGWSEKFEGDWSWTAKNMTIAARMDGVPNTEQKDSGWWVEVRLPFSDLGVPAPQPGDTWRGNFYRINYWGDGREPQLWAWSPTLKKSFHQPNRFGYIVFDGPGQE